MSSAGPFWGRIIRWESNIVSRIVVKLMLKKTVTKCLGARIVCGLVVLHHSFPVQGVRTPKRWLPPGWTTPTLMPEPKGPSLPPMENPDAYQSPLGGKNSGPDPKYNPSFGYEPYWPPGEWVLKTTTRSTLLGSTTIKVPTVCGEDCNFLFQNLGPVCGHRQEHTYASGCEPFSYVHNQCTARYLDNQDEGYLTYPSYCAFLADQCQTKPPKKLLFVHLGKCAATQYLVYQAITTATHVYSRVVWYLSSVDKTMQSVKLIYNTTLPTTTRKRYG